MTKWFYLVAGSIVGGCSRYLVSAATHQRFGFHFPYGTLLVNMTGCLVIGFLNSLADSLPWVGPNERILLMTGVCGAYTTFSSFILETSSLVRKGDVGLASLNVVLSVVLGFLLFRLGELAGKVV
jgi:CrcB protein